MQEVLKLTGLKIDDFESFSLTVEGLEGIAKVKELGSSPRIGSELDILKGTVDLLPSVTSIFLTSYYQDDNFYTLPNAQEIFEFMKLYNFKLLEEFDKNSSYTNYHFVKIS